MEHMPMKLNNLPAPALAALYALVLLLACGLADSIQYAVF